MVRLPRAVSYLLALTLLGVAIAPSHADLACTLEQMQASPDAVIAPCSGQLDSGSLSTADKAQAFYIRGRAYARTGRTLLAAQDFDVAIKLAPERSEIWVSRSNAEGKLKQWGNEWQDLQRALALDPNNAQAWFAMGQIFRNAGDTDQALNAFDTALKANAGEPYSLLFRSDLFASRHQFAEALADATALVNIPSATINKLGYVDYRGVLSNFHVVALNHRAELLDRMGDGAGAQHDLDAAIAEQPSASTFEQRAETALKHDRDEQALQDVEEAARLDPEDGTVQYVRGLALAGLGRFAEGLDAFDKAIALHKGKVISRDQVGLDYEMRARVLRGLGKTDEALSALETAVAFSPEIKTSELRALEARGYWAEDGTPPVGEPFKSALRACMIDKDCN